jgi:predicted transcriptional regulator
MAALPASAPPGILKLFAAHLARRGESARAFATRTGIAYPLILALAGKGALPPKPAQLAILRKELGVEHEDWAVMVAGGRRGGIAMPAAGPLTLQQLVLKNLIRQGFTEQSFARHSGIPYATIMGVTRRGAAPRRDTLATMATLLDIPTAVVDAAVAHTQGTAVPDRGEYMPVTMVQDASVPSLAQLVADTVVRAGSSVATFARTHDIPYVSLMKLISTGEPPQRKAMLKSLAGALRVPAEAFAASLAKSKSSPQPAEAPRQSDKAVNPLHGALLRVVEERHLTTKAFADAADLSVLTAAKFLKRGELPGRTTTHEKLRSLLGLTEIAYSDLLASSRPALPAEDEPDAKVEVPVGRYMAAATGAAPSSTSKGELFELIDRMSPAQLVALKNCLLSVL